MKPSTPTTRDRLRRFVTSPGFISVLVLAALWALFFWRLLTPVLADRVLFAKGDFTLHFFPFANYQAERLWSGELPLWDPYNHSGSPFAANVQWETWYPVRLLAILFSGPGGYTIEVFQLEVAVHILLASLFVYAFLRSLMSNPWPPLVGAVIFAYGGYLTGYPLLQPSILYTATWLPLVLLGVRASVTRPRWRLAGVALGGLALAFSLLGGHPQTMLYVVYGGLAYLLFEGWQAGLRWTGILWRGALLLAVGIGGAAVQLIPAAEFAALTSRVADYAYLDKSGGFAYLEFIKAVIPPFDGNWSPLYVGVAGLLLALGAAMRRKTAHWFWLGGAILALWLSLGGASIVYDLFYTVVPGFGMFRQQERVAYLFSLSLAVLAAYQLDWLLAARRLARVEPGGEADRAVARFRRLANAHLFAVVGALVLAVLLFGANQVDIGPSPLVNGLAFVVFMSLLFNGWLRWQAGDTGPAWRVAGLLVLLIAVDLLTIGKSSNNYVQAADENRVSPPEVLETIQPDGPATWRVDGAVGLVGYGTYWRVPDIYGTGPLTLESIERLRRIPVDRFWEVLAVRYVMLPEDTQPPAEVGMDLLAYGMDDNAQHYQLLELRDPRPLVWPVYDARDASGNAEFARQIMASPEVDLREVAVTLEPLALSLPGERPEDGVSVELERPRPEQLIMTVDTPENALLTVAVINYPGWQAEVNGQPAEIVDTYAGLIGIPVEAGEDIDVRLTFRPTTVIAGGIITALTFVGVAVLLVIIWRRERASAG